MADFDWLHVLSLATHVDGLIGHSQKIVSIISRNAELILIHSWNPRLRGFGWLSIGIQSTTHDLNESLLALSCRLLSRFSSVFICSHLPPSPAVARTPCSSWLIDVRGAVFFSTMVKSDDQRGVVGRSIDLNRKLLVDALLLALGELPAHAWDPRMEDLVRHWLVVVGEAYGIEVIPVTVVIEGRLIILLWCLCPDRRLPVQHVFPHGL